jgi:hypothetical protein
VADPPSGVEGFPNIPEGFPSRMEGKPNFPEGNPNSLEGFPSRFFRNTYYFQWVTKHHAA